MKVSEAHVPSFPSPAQIHLLLRGSQGEPCLTSLLEHLFGKVMGQGVPSSGQGLMGQQRALSSHRVFRAHLLATQILQREKGCMVTFSALVIKPIYSLKAKTSGVNGHWLHSFIHSFNIF